MKTLTERHVQAIWYDAALRPRRLTTRRGTSVAVVSPGTWNLGAGPDFRGAVLEMGPEHRRVVGDVEVHLCPSDWDFHAHGSDPAYRNVIAHVTWGCGPDPKTLPSGAVSIWLGRFVTSDPSFSPEKIDLMAYPYARLPLGERPCARLLANDAARARMLLAEAGRHRLRMKARRLAGRLALPEEGKEDRRQVFYSEVMTALGYAKNAHSFRQVAARVPIAELPCENAAARNALLAAGSFETWHRGGLRPRNSPEARLVAAADVFTRTEAMGMAETSDFSREACRKMSRMLCGCGGERRFMGAGRAGAILANVVVPFALAEERLGDVPTWLPPEDVSEPVRLTAFRLFGRDHNPAAFYSDNGLLIQGLLQIYRDHCLQVHPDCDRCGLLSENAKNR